MRFGVNSITGKIPEVNIGVLGNSDVSEEKFRMEELLRKEVWKARWNA